PSHSFSLSRPPLALHSFPTRRSSDLLPESILFHYVPGFGNARAVSRFVVVALPALSLLAARGFIRLTKARTDLRVAFVAGALGLDRKSTRLNSSHQIISYAVFCLKKK